MLKLLLSGQQNTLTDAALCRAAAQRGSARTLILVPEQRSHMTERRLCELGGDEVSLHAEVLTFSRLAQRVFQELGGGARPVLDGGGRLLLMHLAVQRLKPELHVFRRSAGRADFLSGLIATADECKSCQITPELLTQAAERSGSERLRELGMILGSYDALTLDRAEDPRDRLTRLADTLRGSDWLAGRSVYLLGFTDFTPQEKQVIDLALRDADCVTAALCCDAPDAAGGEIYAATRRTALGLAELAGQQNAKVEWETLPAAGRPSDLDLLARGLFENDTQPSKVPAVCIRTCTAQTPYRELERTAEEILHLVRDEGFHFRDIAVAARSAEEWGGRMQTVFARYGIPIFLSRMDDILQKPVITLVISALDTVADGYEYDDIFRYLKTGLTGIDREDIDILENYVLRWNLRGSDWTGEKGWRRHPDGYGQSWRDRDRELLERLNTLRLEIVTPLEHLRKSGAKTGRDWAMAVYRFLEEVDLPRCLADRSAKLAETGDLQQAEEYRQLWDVLTGALEQCSDLLERDEMGLDDFSDLWRLVLSCYQVGSIPVSLDRLTCGDMARISHGDWKILFLVGADDASLPLITFPAGLLTDEDRTVLSDCGAETTLNADGRLDRELFLIYSCCALPTTRLYVSWSSHAADGAEQRPAFLFRRLEELFPCGVGNYADSDVPSAALPAADAAAAAGDRALLQDLAALTGAESARAALGAADYSRENLSPAAVNALYGKTLRMSASRMDKVKSCHYSYFLQYGLRVKPRRPAGLDAPEAGTYVHYVLERVLGGAKAMGGVDRVTEEDVRRMTQKASAHYVEEKMGGTEDRTPRFRYLFRRLEDETVRVVWNMVEELQRSAFEPVFFELGFGEGKSLPPIRVEADGITVSVTGLVDRVDGWEHNGRLYIRVMDYKTGKKSFDLSDIWHGLNLQMLLYLFTLEEKGLPGEARAVTPTGVLYVPARDIRVGGSRTMADADRQKKLDDKLRRSGLVLDDRAVLDAMEHIPPGGDARFLPVKVSKKTGEISGDKLVSAAQLGKLRRHIHRILRDIAREIGGGCIAADPWFRGEQDTACRFCDFASACHFEDGARGERSRYLYSLKGAAFWEELDAAETGEDEV